MSEEKYKIIEEYEEERKYLEKEYKDIKDQIRCIKRRKLS